MSTKKNEKRVSVRKKSVLPLKVKIEMLDRLRLGESFASISRSFNINESTVRSIKKSEDKIRSSVASTSLSTKIVRDPAIEKMEVALSLWIGDRYQNRVPLSGPIIREKAKRLYAHFKSSYSNECTGGGFQASEGWFNKFKARQSLHNIKIDREAASADTAAERFPEEFEILVADGEYKSEHVFNAEQTALFCKRMPNKKFISKSEKSASGLKAAKDRVTLLLCTNASEDCVIEPVMLYRSLNPRALKNQNKDDLPVFDMINSEPIEEASTNTGNVTFDLKHLSEGLRMANELCDFFTKIDPSTERSLIFKRRIANATAEYQCEMKELLKTAKQQKITKFFKLLPKRELNN